MKNFSSLFLVSMLSGATTLAGYKLFIDNDGFFSKPKSIVTLAANNYSKNASFVPDGLDFTEAADKTVHTVVHVKNVSYRTISNPMLEFFYGYSGGQQQEQVGTGSGVIISEDGYIVTNNHVVKDASDIEITLNNKKTYKAKLIGTDSKMDIALLKINADDKLPYSVFADSDSSKVGEWVLAVGNPYSLTSTVTAGIISAKARNLDTNGIQSFIQTDAAVNPGNSGGALVTMDGKLVGINTAIATPTGVYAGYAFAIPVDIVKKVANDLMNYGTVKRGVLGIRIRNMNSVLSKELKIDRANGVYVDSVMRNSAAKEAGLKEKDVIIGIDGVETLSAASLQELIMRKRPGEKVKITLIRNGDKQIELMATLKEQEKTTETSILKNVDLLKELGVELAEINEADRRRYAVKSGLKVTKLFDGKLKRNTSIREGFVITSVNNKAVSTLESFLDAIEGQRGGIMLEGKYAGDPAYHYYAFGL